MFWQIFSPGKVSYCCPLSIWEQLRGRDIPITLATSNSKQSLFEIWNTKELVNIFTCSPFMKKLVQAWWALGVARSGRESRYFPSESNLGEKEDKDGDNLDLNTCPPSHGCLCHQHPQSGRTRFDWRQRHKLPIHHFEGKTASRLWLILTSNMLQCLIYFPICVSHHS